MCEAGRFGMLSDDLAFGRGLREARGDGTVPRGDWRPMLAAILADLARDVEPSVVSSRFHQALAGWAKAVVTQQSLLDIVLTGGCFQNRILAESTEAALRSAGYRVHQHCSIPPGDGGLAAGQLAVALARLRHSTDVSRR